MTITPEIARQMLATMPKNRKVNLGKVHKYKNQILRGQWKLNGESIKFDTNNQLRDGQHRLIAVIQTNTPIEIFVTYNLDPSSVGTLDTGNMRSNSDFLYMDGNINTHLGAAVAGVISRYRSNTLRLQSSESPSYSEVQEIYAEFPNINSFISDLRPLSIMVPMSIACGLGLLFNKVNQEKCKEFFAGLISGANMEPDDPRFVLRERFFALKNQHKGKSQTYSCLLAALMIKAWNSFIKNEPLRRLRWTVSEDFPQISSMPVSNSSSVHPRRSVDISALNLFSD